MNLITEITDLYKDVEAPTVFFEWSIMAAISGSVGRRVWVNRRGVFLTYPNIYVMLVARSGMKKSIPCTLAERLVLAAEATKVIGGRNSIESIIDVLSKQKTLESGKVLNDAQAFIVNDELNSLLIHNPAAQTILTTLHDSHARTDWTNTLKGEGERVLKSICITMLTATNKSHLEEFIDPASIKGGFIGRTFLIPADRRNKVNLLLSDDENDEIPLIDHSKHIAYLKDLSTLKGPFKIKKTAVDYLTNWYAELAQDLDDDTDDPDETGTLDRLDSQAIKLCMILSLADDIDMTIKQSHADKAIELVTWSASCVRSIVTPVGKSEDAEKLRILLGYLVEQNDFKAYRQEILRAKMRDISAPELSRMMDTLQGAGLIKITNANEGLLYALEERYARKFKIALDSKSSTQRESKVLRLN